MRSFQRQIDVECVLDNLFEVKYYMRVFTVKGFTNYYQFIFNRRLNEKWFLTQVGHKWFVRKGPFQGMNLYQLPVLLLLAYVCGVFKVFYNKWLFVCIFHFFHFILK